MTAALAALGSSRFPVLALVHPRERTRLTVATFALATAIAVVGVRWFGWPIWAGVAEVLALLLVPAAAKWRDDLVRYGPIVTALGALLVLQGFHFVEHISQFVQHHLLGFSLRASNGLLSPANAEWVHFVWNWLVWFATVALVTIGRVRNGWVWLLVAWATAHTLEHTYLMVRHLEVLAELQRLGVRGITAQGLPGIVGLDGWLARAEVTQGTFLCRIPGLTTASRLDVHFAWNVGEFGLLVLAGHRYLRPSRGGTGPAPGPVAERRGKEAFDDQRGAATPGRPRGGRQGARAERVGAGAAVPPAGARRLHGLPPVADATRLLPEPDRLEPADRAAVRRPEELRDAPRRQALLERDGRDRRVRRHQHRPADRSRARHRGPPRPTDPLGRDPLGRPAAVAHLERRGRARLPVDPRLQPGIGNRFLEAIGIGRVSFFGNQLLAIPTIALINVWRHMGYTALLIFAGLQTIPKFVYEAAAIDGASEWQMFRKVTLPLLRPVLALVLTVTVIGSFQIFDTVAVTTGGGPVNATRVINVYIVDRAFTQFDFGYAAALTATLFVVLAVLTAIQLRLLRASQSDLD